MFCALETDHSSVKYLIDPRNTIYSLQFLRTDSDETLLL
jgi:hypothetical protein